MAEQDKDNVLEELKALILACQSSGWTDLSSKWYQSVHLLVLVRKLDWWPDFFLSKIKSTLNIKQRSKNNLIEEKLSMIQFWGGSGHIFDFS